MGLDLLKTTWEMSGASAWTKKYHRFSWQSCKVLEDGSMNGLLDATAISCSVPAAQPTRGCLVLRRPQLVAPNPFPSLASLAVSACLQWTKTSTARQCVT